ncbi:MAG: cytochrome c assembly protein [Planctomycetaceae bacterium]|nr:cytochrome c assembly protein [Planctomycetaceae bacterium]
MASETLPQDATQPEETPAAEARRVFGSESRSLRIPQLVRDALKPLASMKLTVILFALSVFLVFAGTLVQTRLGIWQVMDVYFRSWFAWIEFKIFFPPAWIPGLVSKEWQPFFMDFPGKGAPLKGFYFPGGFLIGSLMALNLAAAHLLRFTVQSKGPRLYAGWGVIGLGCIATYLVITGGSNPDGIQGEPFFNWGTLWWMMKFGLAGLCLGGAYVASRLNKLERLLLQAGSVALGLLTAWLLYENDNVQLGDDSMRILWQLIQATLAGVILLIGCVLAFNKRAGIVLLHGGVGLMMFAELLVTVRAKESQMYIVEGEIENHSADTRTPELAIIDASDAKQDKVVAIPRNFLHVGKTIQHPDLPFDIEVLSYYVNAGMRDLKPGEKTFATAGTGLRRTVNEKPPVNGVDGSGEVDHPAAFIRLKKKNSLDVLGTYLTAVSLHPRLEIPETITVDGKPYNFLMRFEHIYRPYTIRLNEFRHDTYPGTTVAKDFTSQVTIFDPERKEEREARIWMNNPLRYRGETFYQSEWSMDPISNKKMTILQVVSNTGWMIPYVSCMIVVVGMLYQFSLTLLRFLRRRSSLTRQPALQAVVTQPKSGKRSYDVIQPGATWSSWWGPLGVTAIFAIWLLGQARIPEHKTPSTFDFEKFGRIPIVAQGRLKPIDALARSSLRIITDREEITGEDGKKISATQWLLDVMANPPAAAKHKILYIDMQQLVDFFDLPRVPKHRYSILEIIPKLSKFQEEIEKASSLSVNEQDTYQRRLMELARRIRVIDQLNQAFQLPDQFPPVPGREEFEQDRAGADAKLQTLVQFMQFEKQRMEKIEAPRVVPGKSADKPGEKKSPNATGLENWQPYCSALEQSLVMAKIGADPDPMTVAWYSMLSDYRDNKPEEFNKQVDKYLSQINGDKAYGTKPARTDFEAFFNHFAPFYYLCELYVFAFIFTALAWLKWPQFFNRTALLLAIFGFLVHTWAIYARIYISGRPPVTNLYTTAIFIGWGAILLGIAFEMLFKHGIGNIISSVAGYATLFIAHNLASDGNADTFGILVAVLDTQFWLATHVVTINLGYATTFVSGCLGVIYILRGVLTPSMTPEIGKDINRMMYGTLCFGMLFSFFGTVLGGLWGDVSWGRFWGWDPKENGALLIVLWTALILHARWDGWVKDRGFAVLAVGGNIWTAWSWFGVNQLGVGLHAYGKTEGTLEKLGLFFLSQFIVIGLGMLPLSCWWSYRARQKPESTPTTVA